MKSIENKWLRAAIPALLIHCSIGTVYCWSLVKDEIAAYIGNSVGQVEWAFSIAIFCLGMSAAFGGKIVERDVHKSSLISAIFFAAGMAGTGLSIYFKSLVGIYLCYGVIMGIGLGIGYLSPVKTLMLWFKEQKGLATGLAVAGFGLAKVIASPIIESLLGSVGVVKMFFILAVSYFIMMFMGHLLLKKPEGHKEETGKSEFHPLVVLKNPIFIGIWIMFYINITCGLALISQEKNILHEIGFTSVALICSFTAIFNAMGRLGFSALGDKLKDRNTIYKIILTMSIILTALILFTNSLNPTKPIVILVVLLLFAINAGYGGGFSNLPTLLSDKFGMKTISTVHGLALSAWAMAGLTGNQLSSFVYTKTHDYASVLYVTLTLYLIALVVSFVVVKPGKIVD